MIDLHCHILPGVDDGAASLQESLSMAEQAIAQGITHLLCTPHHNNGRYENNKKSTSAIIKIFRFLVNTNTRTPPKTIQIFSFSLLCNLDKRPHHH